jgi:hypothetical protein
VNEPLHVARARGRADCVAVEVVFDDVRRGHERRSAGAGEEVMLTILRAADADMPVPVEHTLIRQYVVGNDQFVDDSLSGRRWWRLRPPRGSG